MATINQLVSEIAHSVKQPNSIPVRRAIKLGIIHARNELIRKSYSNHNYIDKGLLQRFNVSLINVLEGDPYTTGNIFINKNKRTKSQVPKPVRLINNLPFNSVKTIGVSDSIEIPFIKEASTRYYKDLPGMQNLMTYDYINGFIYIHSTKDISISSITIEGVFEYPHIIPVETKEGIFDNIMTDDDNEYLIPEDMIGSIKKLVLETFNPQVIRDTSEVVPLNTIQ